LRQYIVWVCPTLCTILNIYITLEVEYSINNTLPTRPPGILAILVDNCISDISDEEA